MTWSGRTRGGRFGNLFFTLLARRALFLAPFFLFFVALYFLLAAPAARRASVEFARRVGARAGGWRFAFRHFYMFGLLLIERVAVFAGRTHLFSFEAEGERQIAEAAALGRGVVLVTAHLGSWEIMGHLLQRVGRPVALVMYDGIQPELKAAMERVAKGRSFRVLYTDGSPATAAAILEALRAGEIVGMMGDRAFAGQAVAVPFLDGSAELPAGPYALAATARAPLFHVFAVREGRRAYRFHGFPAGVPGYVDRRRKAEDHRHWATSFAERLAGFARAYPTQWGNFYPFWKTP